MLKLIVRFLTPIILFLFIVYLGLAQISYTNEVDRKLAGISNQLELQARSLVQRTLPMVGNVSYLSQSRLMRRGLNDDFARSLGLRELENFTYTHSYYDQVRVLDSTGMEHLRVNNLEDSVEVVSGEKLQDKGKRSYFREAQQMQPKEIYITPLNLNREFGEIERPLKVVLRIIKPIITQQPIEKLGYFIINISVENLVGDLNNANAPGTFMLLNQRGEGMVFSEGEGRYLFDDLDGGKVPRDSLKKLWQAIENEDNGSLKLGDCYYVYQNLNFPDQLSANDDDKVMTFHQPENARITLVRSLTSSEVATWGDLKDTALWMMLLLTVLGLLFAFTIIRGKWRKQVMYERINKLNKELIKSQHDLKIDRKSLKETVGELTRRNMQLKEFSHIISHNIRSPIAGLAILVDYIKSENMEFEKTERTEIINKLRHSVTSLRSLSDDLLQSVRLLDKGKIKMEKVAIQSSINKAKDLLIEQILSTDTQIEVDTSGWRDIKYSRMYLNSIVLNLMSNAIKYRSDERRPKINISTYWEEGRKALRISDNGQGIDLNLHKESIFGLHKTFHRGRSGKGFGLFMVKTEVETMGGSIHVESEPGKGTTFTILF